MSSINPFPTFNYSQPAEYRFSHDSVFLARFAFEFVRDNRLHVENALDLCAGCGIVGLDYLYHCANENRDGFNTQPTVPALIDFLEIQSVYCAHFEENLKRFHSHFSLPTRIRFLLKDYADSAAENKSALYDLILCNPPYFHEGSGKLSPSEFKNRCRFFIDSDLIQLFTAIGSLLSPDGRAFVLVSSSGSNAGHAKNAIEKCSNDLSFKKVGDIRGTDLFEIRRINQY